MKMPDISVQIMQIFDRYKMHQHIFLSMLKKTEIISLDRYSSFCVVEIDASMWIMTQQIKWYRLNGLECDNFISFLLYDVSTIFSSIEFKSSFEMVNNDVFQYNKLVVQFFSLQFMWLRQNNFTFDSKNNCLK